MKQRIKKIIGISAIILALTTLNGCYDNKSHNSILHQKEQQKQTEAYSQLEGKIVSVESATPIKNGPFVDQYDIVTIEGKEGVLHKFVYPNWFQTHAEPHMRAVAGREATIKYKPIESGRIEGKKYIVDAWINGRPRYDPLVVIEAEGMIVFHGIEYKK